MAGTPERLRFYGEPELTPSQQGFLDYALDKVSTEQSINEHIEASGIDSLELVEMLRMEKRAEIPMLENVDDVINPNITNNFPVHFAMFTSHRLMDVQGREMNMPLPITFRELVALRFGSQEVGQGKFSDHRDHPNFMRMLAIFPDFSIPLVGKLSQHAAATVYSHDRNAYREEFKEGLYIAYNIMSQLVDEKDLQGAHPDWYMKT